MASVARAVDLATADTDAGLYRKVTLHLLLILSSCQVFIYRDRLKMDFGKLQILGDLGFSEPVDGLGARIFFIGYFIFELPSHIIVHETKVRL